MPPTKKELLLAALVMMTLPFLVEAVLRLAHVQFEPQLYTADANRGWTLRPNAEGIVSDETPQYIHINSHGFRDREHSYDKPANTFRIAVLGNSWTEALQVPLEKTYAALLERELNERSCFGDRRVEVLNFGVSGYSTAQELLLLQEEVWRYHPDLIVVAFYSARDVANNVKDLNNAGDPAQSPYFVYRGGRLVEDTSFRNLPEVQPRQIKLQNMRGWANDHFRVLQGLDDLVRYGRTRVAMANAKEKAAASGMPGTAATADLEYSVYAPPSRARQASMDEAWRVTEGLLAAIKDDVKAHGAELRIVTLANRPQVIPDPVKRAALIQSLGVTDLSYADRRIDDLAGREAIAVTNLAPALSEYAQARHMYLNGFDTSSLGEGHWNENGHQQAAEVISADLCSSANRPAPSLALAH